MDVSEPRVRRRGFFLHSSDSEPELAEQENPEGFVVRNRSARAQAPRQTGTSATRTATAAPRLNGGRGHSPLTGHRDRDESRPAIRSGSVTGSRQRAHLPR